MNYLEYLKTTFKVSANDGKHIHCYLEDNGEINDFVFQLPNDNYYYDYGKEELDYYVCNYVNRFGGTLNTLDLIGFSCGDDDDMFFTASNKLDFLLFSCNIDDFDVTACYVNDTGITPAYDDYYEIENYSLVTSDGIFDGGASNIGGFSKPLTNNDITIFDYTSLAYENGSYLQDVNTIRGENISLYNVYFHIENSNGDNVYIGYGAPYHDIANSEYQRGLGAGSASGYVTGFDAGYQTGLNAGGANVSTQDATAFSYIGTAFGVVSNVMSLEILPNITLGLCFSIPLVFVLIMTIFKLVRK